MTAAGAAARVRATGRRRQPAPLGTDCIDLYQLHQPDPDGADCRHAWRPRMSLVQAARSGKSAVRIFPSSRFSEAQRRSRTGLRDLSACRTNTACCTASQKHGCSRNASDWAGVPPIFPTGQRPAVRKYRRGHPAPQGSRLVGGRYAADLNEQNLAIVESLIEFSAHRGHTLLELAISWLLMRPAGGIRHRRRDHPGASPRECSPS